MNGRTTKNLKVFLSVMALVRFGFGIKFYLRKHDFLNPSLSRVSRGKRRVKTASDFVFRLKALLDNFDFL